MALVTVVRSFVGMSLQLPDGVVVRPWHFVELEELSDDMRSVLRTLESTRIVQLAQVLDGTPTPVVKV